MCVGVTEPSPLISASAEPRYQCQLQLIHAPSNTHQFLLSIVRSLSMSPHSVPSSRFRLVFLILAAVWCRELVFRQPCCVFTLCLDSSLITTIHLCCSSKSLCHSSPSYHCLLFTPLGYLIKYQNSLATCFLLFTMTAVLTNPVKCTVVVPVNMRTAGQWLRTWPLL